MLDVRYSGPLFSGEAARWGFAVTKIIDRAGGVKAVELIRQNLAGSLVNPTGRYSAAIAATNRSDGTYVTDGGIIYGPWLEGVGLRNQTTRFKGYASFRRAAQQLEREMGQLAEDAIGRSIGRIQ